MIYQIRKQKVDFVFEQDLIFNLINIRKRITIKRQAKQLMISKVRFGFSSFANSVSIKMGSDYPVQTYRLQEFQNTLPKDIKVTREQLLKHFSEISIMREMQLACDKLYKAKKIRGFCHLYTGQEAVAQGMDSALTFEDPLITAYRVHCQAYKRGYSVAQIIAQMLGKRSGATKGKGGSMHYYKQDTNFFGGNGIVGAQIPVGTGLAFALKYKKKQNVCATMFGDGASNQGQLFEAMNMAKLWNLPVLYVCENNIYGMGTSIERSSMNPLIYTRGDKIPGVRLDGNNVFEVKAMTQWAKEWSIKNGPLFVEFMTYRYHGHSMSDPGTTYRTRQQVKKRRSEKDPLKILELIAVQNNLASTQQLENIQISSQDKVLDAIKQAQNGPQCEQPQMMADVYWDNQKHYIRGKLYEESQFPVGQKY